MWEPVGPLPASVYWRRRWVAAATAVSVIALAVWGASAVTHSGAPTRDGAPALTAGRAAMTAPQQDSPSPARAEPVSVPEVAPQALSRALDPTSAASGTAGPPATEGHPDETPRLARTAAVPVPVPSTGPVPCTNAMITTAAETARPEYAHGQRAEFRLVITNVSGQPCVRDLDGARQEIVVWSGDRATRLWSSNDCVDPSSNDLRTLVPGQPVVFTVVWAGRTSTPGCAGARNVVPPGSYQVMTRLDDVISAPTPFALDA